MDYLSLCLICKDENDYLQEWLDYHILAGVERFYIFDNESQVGLRETLKDYIRRGWVKIMECPGKGVQLEVYDACLRMFGANTRWMGFIDTDEFLVPKTTQDLKVFLQDYEAFAGLAVSSLFFGSNQQRSRPDIGQLAGYTMRTDETFFENEIIKSIVQPDQVLMPNSPHDFIYNEKSWCVNEKKLRVDYQRFPNSIEKIQLNHYFCRSLDEIDTKLRRGRGDAGEPWRRHRFEMVNARSVVEDRAILKLVSGFVDGGRTEPGEVAGEIAPERILDSLAHAAALKEPRDMPETPALPLTYRSEVAHFIQLGSIILAAEERLDYAEVKKYLLLQMEIFPHRVLCYTGLAIAALQLNEPAIAWQALSTAWQLAPNSFLVMGGMASFFLRIKNYEMAEKTCALLMEIAPHNLTCMAYMTEALIGQNRYEEALKVGVPVIELESFVGEMPVGMIAHLIEKLTAYLEAQKDYPTLAGLWEAAVRNQPGNSEYQRELARIRQLINKNHSPSNGARRHKR